MTTIEEHITNGFGTVLASEHDLLDVIRRLLDAENSNKNHDLTRILEQHVKQLGAIIALLEQRDKLLPFPDRFGALDQCIPLLMHPVHGVPPHSEHSIANLVKRNLNLRRSIDVLIEQSGHLDGNETGLREASQRHAEMEWVLTALVNEDALQNPGLTGQNREAKGIWENADGPSEPNGGRVAKR
ncbi:MAG TPA: hypothetical protein VKC60_07885 [Opitutaceae bacterium]|nr:hypothetical protein [Opitutaceae bacterium]